MRLQRRIFPDPSDAMVRYTVRRLDGEPVHGEYAFMIAPDGTWEPAEQDMEGVDLSSTERRTYVRESWVLVTRDYLTYREVWDEVEEAWEQVTEESAEPPPDTPVSHP